MTSDRYISLGKWQVHFTWSTNDFRFGTRVAWLAQERCIEFDEEISGAQVLPGPMTICIAKRAFFAASGSPEAPWPEWKSCAFHLRSHPVSKPTFAARIAWRKAKDLTNQIEWSNHIKKTKRHRIYHIKTYTLLQFVLISWDNQLRFPFWDRTFLLKAKCTAVLQVSHRFIGDWNRYHCQDFEIVFQKLNFAANVRDIFFTCSAALLHVWVLAHISSLSWSP